MSLEESVIGQSSHEELKFMDSGRIDDAGRPRLAKWCLALLRRKA